jgi:hypothetical protein
MKTIPFIVCIFACVHGALAASWSLSERSIVKKIPDVFLKHTAGPVLQPSDSDVSDAISFGAKSKEDASVLDYAYLIKESVSGWRSDVIYVTVSTPLHQIALHSFEQSKAYRSVDEEKVSFLRKARVVKISICQQYMSRAFTAIPVKRDVILLRDGVRVKPLTEIQSYHGAFPFSDRTADVQRMAGLEGIQQAALASMRDSLASMTPEQRKAMIPKLRAMGVSDSQLRAILGVDVEGLQRLSGADNASATLSVSECDGFFEISELRKPGRYEVVFREPKVEFGGVTQDKEVRFPISFSKFR